MPRPVQSKMNRLMGAVTVSCPECRVLLMGPWLTCRAAEPDRVVKIVDDAYVAYRHLAALAADRPLS